MKNLLFKGFFLIAPKWGWWILLAGCWAAFYESFFASNNDGVTEMPSIIGLVIGLLFAVYSAYVTYRGER